MWPAGASPVGVTSHRHHPRPAWHAGASPGRPGWPTGSRLADLAFSPIWVDKW